jgi:hypothetical protein
MAEDRPFSKREQRDAKNLMRTGFTEREAYDRTINLRKEKAIKDEHRERMKREKKERKEQKERKAQEKKEHHGHKKLEKPAQIEHVDRDTGEVKLKVQDDGVKAYKIKVDSEHGVRVKREPKGDRERTRGRPRTNK